MIGVFLLSTNQFGAGLEVLQGLQLLFTKVKWPFVKTVFFFLTQKASSSAPQAPDWVTQPGWPWVLADHGGCPKEGLEEAQGLGWQAKAQAGSVFSPFPSYSVSYDLLRPLHGFFLRGLSCIDTIISIIWLLIYELKIRQLGLKVLLYRTTMTSSSRPARCLDCSPLQGPALTGVPRVKEE